MSLYLCALFCASQTFICSSSSQRKKRRHLGVHTAQTFIPPPYHHRHHDHNHLISNICPLTLSVTTTQRSLLFTAKTITVYSTATLILHPPHLCPLLSSLKIYQVYFCVKCEERHSSSITPVLPVDDCGSQHYLLLCGQDGPARLPLMLQNCSSLQNPCSLQRDLRCSSLNALHQTSFVLDLWPVCSACWDWGDGVCLLCNVALWEVCL